MDQLIRSGEVLALGELAKELGVTERTLYRDLAHMKNRLGLPIARHPALGYRYTRPVPPLDSREAVAGPNSAGKGPQAGRPTRLRRLLETLHQALYEHRTVWIAFVDRPEADAGFLLNPLFLSRIRGEVALFGVRPSDGALLNVPTRRLECVRPTLETFEEPIPSGAKVRESDGWVAAGSRHQVRLRFPAAQEWARDLLVTESQSVEETPEELVLSFRTDDLAGAKLLVCLLGRSVQVEGPPALLALLNRE